MKVLHVTYSLSGGGSGIAPRRLHEALSSAGVQSQMLYMNPFSGERTGLSAFEKKLNGLQNITIRKVIGRERSLNIFPTRILNRINESDADVVHLHWVHGEMLSIRQFAQINKPLVWTFHDMWPICGLEHYVDGNGFAEGYACEHGLSGYIYRKKLKYWNTLNAKIITPSKWMGECVCRSRLFANSSISVIANALDLTIFHPQDQTNCRKEFNLPRNKKLILFGAFDLSVRRKGGDIFDEALGKLEMKEVELVVFGSKQQVLDTKLFVHHVGLVADEKRMARLYNAADVMCVPSRMESFGLTAAEPLACGTPVVAFDVTGLKDVVDHKQNGYLARPYDTDDFVSGISWILNNAHNGSFFRENGTQKARACFDFKRVAEKHIELYEHCIE